jgi:hypothetical protein
MDTTAVEHTNTGLGVYENLVQYGALGIVVIALGYVAWKMWNKTMAEKDALQKRVEELERMLLDEKLKK